MLLVTGVIPKIFFSSVYNFDFSGHSLSRCNRDAARHDASNIRYNMLLALLKSCEYLAPPKLREGAVCQIYYHGSVHISLILITDLLFVYLLVIHHHL